MADMQNPIFKDDEKARQALEAIRWPNGPVCPHCGSFNKIAAVGGKKHRPGLYYCNGCNGTFTVTVGTVFERSKIGLSKWWLAVYLMSSSKKGVSSHQLHRTLGVTYKTAWFMSHRIREAMRDGQLGPMGGAGSTVEVDETYIGRKKGKHKGPGYEHKRAILTLVERDGRARSFHIEQATIKSVTPILQANIDRETTLHTDEAGQYHYMRDSFAKHETVNHAIKEYARGDVTTNTVEGYFSIFKRGMKGIYQHCGEQHLHRYLAEYDFRYNNRIALGVDDNARAVNALKGIEGKRLTYRRTSQRPNV